MTVFHPFSKPLFLLLLALALPPVPSPLVAKPETTNLAAGKRVIFSSQPTYHAPKGKDLGLVLTDGVHISDRADFSKINDLKVSWKWEATPSTRVNLMVDLGKRCEIDEIAMSLGLFSVPVWAEAFASDDGVHFRKIADRSRWSDPAYYQGEGIYPLNNTDKNISYTWRFHTPGATGRYIGLRFIKGSSFAADELQVFGREAGETSGEATGEAGDFSVTQPQPFFYKPQLLIPTNISVPQPMALPGDQPWQGVLELELDLPRGLSLLNAPERSEQEMLEDGTTRHRLRFTDPKPSQNLFNFFLRASKDQDGKNNKILWRYRFGEWQSPDMTTPYHTVTVPETPAPRRLVTVGLGWWRLASTGLHWPDLLASFRRLGINTVSIAGDSRNPLWLPADPSDPGRELFHEARRQGFKIFAADATFMPPWRKYPNSSPEHRELYCQLPDGSVSERICPSYRGRYYQEEVQRFARQMVEANPDIVSLDMEAWHHTYEPRKDCQRCEADYKASGLADWDSWKKAKGTAMTRDAIDAARKQLKANDLSADFTAFVWALGTTNDGAYNPFAIFSFEALYPNYIQMADPYMYSTYTPGYLWMLADHYRANRKKLPGNDLMACLTPGDRGALPGKAFQWAILETFCNGARGICFYSGRRWDGETLLAYGDAIRAITPVEDAIMEGRLIEQEAAVNEPGRLSGIHHGDTMVLLASDYRRQSGDKLTLNVTLEADASCLRDLITGEILEKNLPAGEHTVTIPLNGEQARLLEISSSEM